MLQKIKTSIIFLFLALLVLGFFIILEKKDLTLQPCSLELEEREITFGGVSITVEVADTQRARQCGLSYRESLAPSSGMLFVFDEFDYHGIWMKDMQFSIDIIWLDNEFRVVDSKKNVLPESYPEIFTPTKKAALVLEVVSGFIEEHSIERGEAFSY